MEKIEFNLQTFLTDMRSELNDKMDQIKEIQAKHDTRLALLERTQSTLKWAAGTVIVAALGLFVDVIKNHWK